MFDKLHHVNGNNCAIDVTDAVNSSDSLKPSLIKDKPRRIPNGVKTEQIEDWSSLARFEKLIKLEMENLAATKNHQKANGTKTPVSTKLSNANILKPEKHVCSRSLIQ